MASLTDILSGAGEFLDDYSRPIGLGLNLAGNYLGYRQGQYEADAMRRWNDQLAQRQYADQVNRYNQMVHAQQASEAALLAGYQNATEHWGDYFDEYQATLPEFSAPNKEAAVDAEIAKRTGNIQQAIQEGHSADMGSNVKGRMSASYTGAKNAAADRTLADVMQRGALMGTLAGFEADPMREGKIVGNLNFASSNAQRQANDAMERARLEAQIAGQLPPEMPQYIEPPDIEDRYGSLGAILGTGANLLNLYTATRGAKDDSGYVSPYNLSRQGNVTLDDAFKNQPGANLGLSWAQRVGGFYGQ